jgi:hypothetical protein
MSNTYSTTVLWNTLLSQQDITTKDIDHIRCIRLTGRISNCPRYEDPDEIYHLNFPVIISPNRASRANATSILLSDQIWLSEDLIAFECQTFCASNN